MEICSARDAVGADYLITTGKDAVKRFPHLQELGNVYATVLEVNIEDMQNLTDMLGKLL
jgi:tetraacyldisaccharide-1-P 4'-kinase